MPKIVKTLYACGANDDGQLGIGRAQDREFDLNEVPAPPPKNNVGLKDLKGGGEHTLILTSDRELYVCGSKWNNACGEVEARRKTNTKGSSIPTFNGFRTHLYEFERQFKDIDMIATTFTCSAALWHESVKNPEKGADEIRASMIYTCGKGEHGELGRGYPHKSTMVRDWNNCIPTHHLQFTPPMVDIAGGMDHFVVVREDGEALGWGNGRRGQLGDEKNGFTKNDFFLPIYIKTPRFDFPAVKAACGRYFTVLVAAPDNGKFVVLADENHPVRKELPNDLKGWKQIHASWDTWYVLFNSGRMLAFGKNNLGQHPPLDLPSIETCSVGSSHVVALTKETPPRVISWGWGMHGECGSPVDESDVAPVSDRYREIAVDGDIEFLGAGCATTFVMASKEVQTKPEYYAGLARHAVPHRAKRSDHRSPLTETEDDIPDNFTGDALS